MKFVLPKLKLDIGIEIDFCEQCATLKPKCTLYDRRIICPKCRELLIKRKDKKEIDNDYRKKLRLHYGLGASDG